MKITLDLPDTLIETVIQGIMANFPEASRCSALYCGSYCYDPMLFNFIDTETNKEYNLDKATLLKAFPLLFTDKWPKGLTQPPVSNDPEVWDNWLCQADANDFDAFVQLACLGEVIYG